ncbi:hypothetical protein HPB52_005482 [Rhipicephalus sanguineus]|uniref:Uncharacterized protein n=1 Tax=Rhipicephalus sanguineus TaxID=34632 RepID=A0A9D4PYD9_RHISA|nr:hypothetical protein HPB52_005482 [Rhipicephalus sanguineus]
MPANDYKIVVRPRDGLNLSVCSEAEIADCIRKTLRFPDTTTITDVVQDICPTPAVKRCQKCGQDNPLQEHECEPKCVVCGGPHMARSKDCRKRFATPPIIRRRRLEQRVSQSPQEPTPHQGGHPQRPSRSKERKRQEPGAARSRSRFLSFPPLPTKPRSQSRPRNNQAAVDDKKLQALEAQIAQLSEIISRQEKEIAQLKQLQRSDQPTTQVLANPNEPSAAKEDNNLDDNSPPPKRKAPKVDRTTHMTAQIDEVSRQGDSAQPFKATKPSKPYDRRSTTSIPRPTQAPSQSALPYPAPLYGPPAHDGAQ